MKKFLTLFSFLFLFAGVMWGQTTVFSDDFTTSEGTSFDQSGAIGTSTTWSVNPLSDFGGKIDGGLLTLTNDASATANASGYVFAYTNTSSFSSPYNTTLSSNSGTVSWIFNMRQIRTDPAGLASGNYGAAFVLAANGTDVNYGGTADGYAITLGNSGSTDPIKLVEFTNGLNVSTAIITSNTVGLTDFGANYLSLKVTYTVATNTWELFVRDDGSSAFTDPNTGTLTSQGTAINSTYTGSSLPYMGGYWNGSTAGSQTAFFDNVFVIAEAGVVSQPTTQASDIIFSSVGANQMTIDWTSGDGSNRVVVMKSGSAVDSDPVDASTYTASATFGSGTEIGTGNFVVYNGSGSSVTVTGLSASTTYHARVYEFNGSGGSEDYYAATATNNPNSQSTSAAVSSASDIVAANNEVSNIDYASYQSASITTTGDALRIWSFTIQDGGGSADADAFGTELTDVTIGKSAGNTETSWASRIREAALFDGSTKIAEVSVTGETISFAGMSGANVTAADDGSKTLDLYLTFETTATDNNQYGFTVTSAVGDPAKSQFAAADAGATASSVTGDANKVEVTATAVMYGQQPSGVATNVAMSPAVTVKAVDVNGNTDLDYATDISITATGATLTGSPVTASPASGIATFSSLTFTTASNSVTLSASSGAFTPASSNGFAVYVPLNQNDVMISHLSAAYSGASNEFVVLFNNTASSIDLIGYEVKYFASTGSSGSAGFQFTTSTPIPSRCYILLSPDATVTVGTVSVARDYSFTSGLSGTAGQLVLREISNTSNIIFAVAYGTATFTYVAGMSDAATWSGTGMISLTASGNTYTRTSYNSSNTQYSFTSAASITELPSSSTAPLPVELTSFTASVRGKGVEIAWKTATEVNNYGFEIEKKAVSGWPLANSQQLNANYWSKIGFVEGNGTTNSPKSYNFLDISAQGKVAYRLKQIDRDGKFTYSNQVEATGSVVANYSLAQNHPNPFNPSTVISYQLPLNGYVTLKVYDMIGKEIATLVNGMQEAGEHTTSFNASHLPSGLYFYSLQTKNFNATKKMLLVK